MKDIKVRLDHDRDDPIISIEPKRDFKMEVQLGDGIEALIYIYGGIPTRKQFERLRDFLMLQEAALVGSDYDVIKRQDFGECEHHPGVKKNNRNQCALCIKEQLKEGQKRRWSKHRESQGA